MDQPTAIPQPRAAMPAWMISGVTHVAILGIFSLVVFLASPPDEEFPLVPLTTIDPPHIVPVKPPMVPGTNPVDDPPIAIEAEPADVTTPYSDL